MSVVFITAAFPILNCLASFLRAQQSGTDFSIRWKWDDGDVAIWDNRTNSHSAIYEDVGVSRRHAVRVAATGETPVLTEEGKSREEEVFRARGWKVERGVRKGERRAAGYKD